MLVSDEKKASNTTMDTVIVRGGRAPCYRARSRIETLRIGA